MADKIQPWGMMNRFSVQEADGQPAQQFVSWCQTVSNRLNALAMPTSIQPTAAGTDAELINNLINELKTKGVL